MNSSGGRRRIPDLGRNFFLVLNVTVKCTSRRFMEVLIATAKIHYFWIRTSKTEGWDILRYRFRTLVTRLNVSTFPCNLWDKY